LAFAPFAFVVKGAITSVETLRNWWMGVALAAVTLTAFLFTQRQKTSKDALDGFAHKLIPILVFLRFRWLNEIWKWFALIITEVFRFITQLLEGEGGVLWAIVILALLVSIIGAGRS